MVDLGFFTEADVKETLTYLIKRETQNKLPARGTPKALILGGQSGAGKSALYGLNANAVPINGDEYRNFHPQNRLLDERYGKESVTHKSAFSGKIVEGLIDAISAKSYDLIVEGTLRKTEAALKTATLLKERGYETELAIMAVKPEISYASTILRYEMMLSKNALARFTPKAIHDEIVRNISANADAIYLGQQKNVENARFNNIRIFDRNLNVLYDMQKTPYISPAEKLNAVLFGKWSSCEIEALKDIKEKALALMKERNAMETEIRVLLDIKPTELRPLTMKEWEAKIRQRESEIEGRQAGNSLKKHRTAEAER